MMKNARRKSALLFPRYRRLVLWKPGMCLVTGMVAAAASLLTVQSVQAANDAWALTPASGNFSGTNWTTGQTVPGAATGTVASGDTLYFGASSVTSLTNDDTGFSFVGFNFNTGTINAPTGAFTIGGNTFTLTGNIVNASPVLQTINAPFSMTAARTFSTTAGDGFLRLGGDISGTGGQIITGVGGTVGQTGGALFLNGNNSFTGISATFSTITTTASLLINGSAPAVNGTPAVAGNTVVLGSNTAAGTGTIVFSSNGGTLSAASGGVTIANGIITNNTNGTFGSGGNITVNGLFQFGGTNFITVNNNTTLAGGVDIRDGTASGMGRTANFNGTGNLTISGTISNGTAGAVGALAYTGTGAMTLSGNNTYTGVTQLLGGTTTLDYTTNAGTKISGAATGGALTLGGGILNLGGGATTEVVSGTTLQPGSSFINQTGSGTSTITLGGLTRSAGSTLSLVTGGIARTTTGTANTILTSTAGVVGVVGGNDWAAKDAANSTIVGLSTTTTGYTASTPTSVASGANTDVLTNVDLAASGGSTSTLRFNTPGAQTINVAGQTLTLTQGGILVTPAVGANQTTITGGTLKAGSNNALIVFQNNTDPSGGLTIASTVADGSGASTFIKSGDGLVRLTNTASTYTGSNYLNAGITNIAADQSLGAAPAAAAVTQLTMNGGTLQFGADNIALNANRGVALQGNGGTFDTNGTTGSTINGIIANGAQPAVTTGRLIKTGNGTLTLNPTAGPNTYTGATIVNGGTLSLARAGSAPGVGGTLAATPIAINPTGTLLLSANNTMNSTLPVTLAGGTVSIANGVQQGSAIPADGTGTSFVGAGLLTLTANSSLNFVGSSGTVIFNSFDPTNLNTGNFTLTVSGTNFGTSTSSVDGANDRLVFNQLLSLSQLSDIVFNINGNLFAAVETQLGTSTFYEVLPGGAVAVPEPGTYVMVLGGAALLVGLQRSRRRLA